MIEAGEVVELLRDVKAVQIPSGGEIELKKGRRVTVTQSLGGSHTVHVAELGGLYRIGDRDADALGIEVAATAMAAPAGDLDAQVWSVLKSCYDPEIPVNIVDLGLIYSLALKDKRVEIKMTLTAPGCGMGPAIAADAKQKILGLEGIDEAEVEVVWEPPWNPSMISPEGKAKLGIE
jgi:probable FeS assembly SUF system protein SufT